MNTATFSLATFAPALPEIVLALKLEWAFSKDEILGGVFLRAQDSTLASSSLLAIPGDYDL